MSDCRSRPPTPIDATFNQSSAGLPLRILTKRAAAAAAAIQLNYAENRDD